MSQPCDSPYSHDTSTLIRSIALSVAPIRATVTPVTLGSYFFVLNVEEVVRWSHSYGFPSAPNDTVLDTVPVTMFVVELNGEVRAFVDCKVPLVVSHC
jgi:hypothetical protein